MSAGTPLLVRSALLSLLAFALSQQPAAAQAGNIPDAPGESLAFAPPVSSLVLTRELRRPLPDGNEIVTERSYEVHIEKQDAGYVVNGTLIAVKVGAPEELRVLAELERNRPDTGLFPMRLDAEGMLAQDEERLPAEPAKTLSQGVQMVAEQLRRMKLPAVDAVQARAFVHQFLARPAMTAWPADLFRPSPGKRSDARELALPNGQHGQVVVETEAAAQPATGLLARFDRVVTTRIANDTRRTIETWRLTSSR